MGRNCTESFQQVIESFDPARAYAGINLLHLVKLLNIGMTNIYALKALTNVRLPIIRLEEHNVLLNTPSELLQSS